MTNTPNNNATPRNLLDSFTDRERILAKFTHLLGSTQAGEFRLLAIKGNSGTGKTFLIEYLSKRVCPPAGWQTGVLAFAQSFPDFRTILDGLEDAFKQCVPRESLKSYRTQRDAYKHSFDEYRVSITINQHVDAQEASSVSQTQMSASVNAELRRRELQLRAELTRALLELAEECESPLCLLLDGYERLAETDPELASWLWEEVLLNLPRHTPHPLLVVCCGWDHPLNAALQPFTTYEELDDFDTLRVKDYLHAQSILPSDTSAQDALVNAFYTLSQGHPLVLSLAVAYFQTLPEAERTPQSLHTHSPLITEEARVQWLEERLLKRLPEPHRTLLERGPILRSFDQSALQALLQLDGDKQNYVLDDRTYAQFLNYPFINRKNAQGNELLAFPTFHDLARQVRIDSLRRLHPDTKQQLHDVMAEYHGRIAAVLQQRNTSSQVPSNNSPYSEWFVEIPEQEFRALLELLYHGLQMYEIQDKAFNAWQKLVGQVVEGWRPKQAGPLLEMVRQLAEDGEPFFNKRSNTYGQYLMWYSRFLEQEARWDEALLALQKAAQVFEWQTNISDLAVCLNNSGSIYNSQGQLATALDYLKRALTLTQQMGDPTDIAISLNNIGFIYHSQGQLVLALDYHQRALTLFEKVDSSADIAISLNNIGMIYKSQDQLEKALDYLRRALALFEQVSNPDAIATTLNNIGNIYKSQGQLIPALDYYQRALALREQVSNPTDIATTLNDIGMIYQLQSQLEKSLDYYQRAFVLFEKVSSPAAIATSLNNIGMIYHSQNQFERALDYYQRSLVLREQVGNPADIANSLHNLGSIYYSQEQWGDALPLFLRSLSLYEQMGDGFESDVDDELEAVVMCYMKLGEIE